MEKLFKRVPEKILSGAGFVLLDSIKDNNITKFKDLWKSVNIYSDTTIKVIETAISDYLKGCYNIDEEILDELIKASVYNGSTTHKCCIKLSHDKCKKFIDMYIYHGIDPYFCEWFMEGIICYPCPCAQYIPCYVNETTSDEEILEIIKYLVSINVNISMNSMIGSVYRSLNKTTSYMLEQNKITRDVLDQRIKEDREW